MDNFIAEKHRPYIRKPEGATVAVLMVHGICGTPRQFDAIIPDIPEDYAIYNILLSGHGGDIGDFSRASMKAWHSEVADTLDMLYNRYEVLYLVGHSMGTLLLMNTVGRYADKVAAMIFLASPLKMYMSPKMIPITLKIAFDKYDRKNTYHAAMREAYSMKPDGRLWRYIGWIPRYLELFELARKTRPLAKTLPVPTYVFQSYNDELVLRSASKYFEENSSAVLHFLGGSRHFDYSSDDLAYLKGRFAEILRSTHE